MFRSIQIATAAILTCLMLVVSTTSYLGLSYCLCQNEIFLGDCVCETEIIETSTSCCSSKSCSSHISHTIVAMDSNINHQAKILCPDCFIKINWDLGHCILPNLTEFQSTSQIELDGGFTLQDTKTISAHTSLRIINTRGSPYGTTSPPPPASEPLYKRLSVYLI